MYYVHVHVHEHVHVTCNMYIHVHSACTCVHMWSVPATPVAWPVDHNVTPSLAFYWAAHCSSYSLYCHAARETARVKRCPCPCGPSAFAKSFGAANPLRPLAPLRGALARRVLSRGGPGESESVSPARRLCGLTLPVVPAGFRCMDCRDCTSFWGAWESL